MLTKAILTGGVLSVLAGSIVYFGTEGVDALQPDPSVDVRMEDTKLAGAAESVAEAAHPHSKESKQTARDIRKAKAKARSEARAEAKAKAKAEATAKAEAEAEASAKVEAELEMEATIAQAEAALAQVETADPEAPAKGVAEAQGYADGKLVTSEAKTETSKKKAKTRWLDQYLKSNKTKKTKAKSPETKSDVIDVVVVEKSDEIEIEVETGRKMMSEEGHHPNETKRVKRKIIIKTDDGQTHSWSSDDKAALGAEGDIESGLIEGLFGEAEGVEDALKSGDIRIMKMGDKKHKGKGHHKNKGQHHMNAHKAFEYDAVLNEAKKLQVIDMRDEAVLEIVDFVLDHGDVGYAADIVDELSSPELRDTARARIGVKLATWGDMDAAFAVLDEIEIDQLAAPIRLEIITALMATHAERAAAHKGR